MAKAKPTPVPHHRGVYACCNWKKRIEPALYKKAKENAEP